MNLENVLNDTKLIYPEIILAIGAMVSVLVGAFLGKKSYRFVTYLSVAVLLLSGWAALYFRPATDMIAFNGSLSIDSFGAFAKFILALTSSAAILLSIDYLDSKKIEKPEYPVLAVLAVLGMYIMVSAHDLLALYMGVELQSLALYVLAAYARNDQKSSEAGLKYFVLGALSSGILLYGSSMVYGFSGTINFGKLNELVATSLNIGIIFGMVFVLCGVAFKMSVAPFHMWTPDVYEGSPTPSTAFFASAPKMAAAVLFARVCFDGFGSIIEQWQDIVIIMAILSMLFGAFFALRQNNLKRLLAYSSIANMGYAAAAIAAGPKFGQEALLVFISIYAITSVGIFGVLLNLVDKNGKYLENLSDISGLSKQKPFIAISLTLLIFSVSGIPPLAGFFGKLQVLVALVNSNLVPVAVVLVIASVISAFYYLRIIKTVWFDAPTKEIVGGRPTTQILLSGTLFAIAALTPFIGLLYTAAAFASKIIK